TTNDDYLCWQPAPARAKLIGAIGEDVIVKLVNERNNNGAGVVVFQQNNGERLTHATYRPTSELRLTLRASGEWTPFWVGGKFESRNDKDTMIVAFNLRNTKLGELPVMVRVRKNAERMTRDEINQFLDALAKVHRLENGRPGRGYSKYAEAHEAAFLYGIHHASDPAARFPLFVAWHRAFLLSLERELQAMDPRVSLPYWRFDQPAPNLFSPDFLGRVPEPRSSPVDYEVEFSSDNPIRSWEMGDSEGPLKRVRNGTMTRDGGVITPVSTNTLERLFNIPINSDYVGVNGALEARYHNQPHSWIQGWLASGSSPRDPLFFLLHANVDRAWAHWQARNGKFDPTGTDESTYSAPGEYPGETIPDRFRKGSYAKDTMWPWNRADGDQGTPDALDDWPTGSFEMPLAHGTAGVASPPTPASQIDFLDIHGKGLAHGVCYDDLDFEGHEILVTP
ncbi:MAG TPA: tyrosinase family protein, partial [Nitrospirales bacterium]|nr:tyrosinase family protein [Nitrospirales bacterium]